jgi:carboxyl-terminal processing protease
LYVRDDGGGYQLLLISLDFIEQVLSYKLNQQEEKKEVLYDRDKKIEWDGPLVIMVNSFSASASEILAAAIQDYKEGLLLVVSKHMVKERCRM